MKRNELLILAAALLVAGVVSYFASASPDGLEYKLGDRSSAQAEAPKPFPAPFPDYEVPNAPSRFIANGVAGVIGVLATFVGLYLAVRFLTVTRQRKP